MSKRNAANLLMLLGSIIWGAAFVAQNIGGEIIGPYTFGAIRFFLGSLVLLPVMFFSKRAAVKSGAPQAPDAPFSQYIKAGVICGLALFLGSTLQQFGIMQTTAGKAGFVTALYIVLVPIFAFIFLRRKLSARVLIAVVLALVGVFLLCVSEQMSVNRGDIITFAGSIFWAVQILVLEKYSQHLDGLKFAVCEFMTCSLICAVLMFVIEKPTWAQISAAAIPLLYCGLLSVGVGFTAQIICLKYTEPTVASLIMSTESVFSAVFGFLILHEVLSAKQIFGCVLVFAAVILAQIVPRAKKPQTPPPDGISAQAQQQ